VSYTVRFTPAAAKDLQRLFDFLAEQDVQAAKRARSAIAKGIEFLRTFPFSCRKASPEHPLLRELIISVKSNARSDSFASSPARGRGLRRGSGHGTFQSRELLVMAAGANGYVALFEIEDSQTVTVLAIRHQREEDFF
jgi:plasmid stabilization system protein ParE